MAGGKETPRQKMIGMMYLVLTALLAMNISKDVLNAFIQINKGLGKTNEILEDKAEASIGAINGSKEGAKAVPFQQAAVQVDGWADDMMSYIEEMKARSMACAVNRNEDGTGFEEFIVEGKAIFPDYKNAEGDQLVKTPDSQDQTSLLIGSEPSNPKQDPFSASDLKKKLNEYKDRLLGLTFLRADSSGKKFVLPDDVKASISAAFEFPAGVDHDGVEEPWEVNNFYHMPLVAVLANLAKIQTDVMNAKNNVITALQAGINADDVKFTDITVAVVPKQSYILRGGEFEAEIYLAAFNKTSQTKIYMAGEGSPTAAPVEFDVTGKQPSAVSNSEGKCIFKVNTGGMSLGEHGYKGQIAYLKNGVETYIPFNVPPFMVGEPALVVSPTQMNVFYRGLDNPVEISVPGVPQSSVEATCTGCETFKKGEKGTWVVRPAAGKDAKISVSATINGEKKSIGTKDFRVKTIPDPVPSFAGKKPTDGTITQADLGLSQGCRAVMENFDFDVKVTVKTYKLTIVSGNGTLKEYPQGRPGVDDALRQALQKAKKGERVFIEDIMVDMPDGKARKLNPITLKVI